MSLQPIKDAWHWLLDHLAPVPLVEPDPDWAAKLAEPAPAKSAPLALTAAAPSTRRPGGLIRAIREAEAELGLAAAPVPLRVGAANLAPVPRPRIPQLPLYSAPQPGPAVPLPAWAAQQSRAYRGVYTARDLPAAKPDAQLVAVSFEQLHPDASYGARLAHLWREHEARITLARGLVYNLGADHLKAFAREFAPAGAR